MSKQGLDYIKRVEGILLEAYRLKRGTLPAWNDIGGEIIGRNKVKSNNINIVLSFANP